MLAFLQPVDGVLSSAQLTRKLEAHRIGTGIAPTSAAETDGCEPPNPYSEQALGGASGFGNLGNNITISERRSNGRSTSEETKRTGAVDRRK